MLLQDPNELLNEYGADALRLYLINSPVVRGETLRFKKEGVFAVVKDVFLPWYNAYRFLVQNVLRLQQQQGIIFQPTKACFCLFGSSAAACACKCQADAQALRHCILLLTLLSASTCAALWAFSMPIVSLLRNRLHWYLPEMRVLQRIAKLRKVVLDRISDVQLTSCR